MKSNSLIYERRIRLLQNILIKFFFILLLGGAADKNGELMPGDEIIFVNDKDFTTLSRIEAWNLMKKIPDGIVKIHIYRKS